MERDTEPTVKQQVESGESYGKEGEQEGGVKETQAQEDPQGQLTWDHGGTQRLDTNQGACRS